MTTRGTMRAEIESDTERSDTTAINTKIAQAIGFYQTHRFWFNESRSITFSTVDGTDLYDFGSGQEITTEFYTIDSVWVLEGTQQHPVTRRDYRDLEDLLDTTPQEGRPSSYAYINRALRFYPVPDAVYTIRITGHIKIATPAADDTANNEWMVEAYDLIMARTKAQLYAHRWEDPANAALMRGLETEELRKLRNVTTSKVGSGQLIPTQF